MEAPGLRLLGRQDDDGVKADKPTVLAGPAVGAMAMASGVFAAWWRRRQAYDLRLFRLSQTAPIVLPTHRAIAPSAFFVEPIVERLVIQPCPQSRARQGPPLRRPPVVIRAWELRNECVALFRWLLGSLVLLLRALLPAFYAASHVAFASSFSSATTGLAKAPTPNKAAAVGRRASLAVPAWGPSFFRTWNGPGSPSTTCKEHYSCAPRNPRNGVGEAALLTPRAA